MSDSINTKKLLVEVQENGIIRRESDGKFMGRLDESVIPYSELAGSEPQLAHPKKNIKKESGDGSSL